MLNSEEFTSGRTPGPDDGVSHKFKPNYSLNYSDVYLNNRLGIVLSVQESNLYNEQYRVDHTYNRVPTTADPRAQVLTQVLLKDGPKWTERGSYTAVVDFKATPSTSLSRLPRSTRALPCGVLQPAGHDDRRRHARHRPRRRPADVRQRSPRTGGNIVFGGVQRPEVHQHDERSSQASSTRRAIFVRRTVPSVRRHSRNDYDNLAHGTVANSPVNNLTGIGFTAMHVPPPRTRTGIFSRPAGRIEPDLKLLQKNPRISDEQSFRTRSTSRRAT